MSTDPNDEIVETVRLPQFDYLRGYDADIQENVWRAVAFYHIGW